MSDKDPTLAFEHEQFARGVPLVIGIDEVGRGAIAGPVAVGAHVVRQSVQEMPPGLRDSKLLSEKKREALHPILCEWGIGSVGFVSAADIDTHGIVASLGEAGRRALLTLHEAGVPVTEAVILVDGTHDWLSPALRTPLQVVTRVRADRECASVAAASVRAKVERDALMRQAHLAEPHYGWNTNKGYGSNAHYAGIAAHGLSALHRASWVNLAAVG